MFSDPNVFPSPSHQHLRRRLLKAAGASLLLVPGVALADAWRRIDAISKTLGNGQITQGGIDISLPLVAEDGSSVPLAISSSRPGSAARIQKLFIFASGNPTPEVAKFEFGPEVPTVNLATRIRLSESQTVVVVARTEDGETLLAQRDVRVTTSGCVAPARADASSEMTARVRVPKTWKTGSPAEVVSMINHPMTTGLAQDATGRTPPQRIIETFQVSLDGRPLIQATFFRSLAANPYLRFEVAPQQSGQMRFVWTEDTGRAVEESAAVKVS